MNDLKINYTSCLLFVFTRLHEKLVDEQTLTRIYDFLEFKTLIPNTKILTFPTITTATMAYGSDMCVDYSTMARHIKENGKDILVVKNNLDPIEECIKNKWSRAEPILRRRARIANKHPNIISKRTRQHGEGKNGMYFNESMEIVYGDEAKRYNIRLSPIQGSIQVLGLNSPIYVNATKCVDRVLDYIKASLDMESKYKVSNRRLTIINCKSELVSYKDNQFLLLEKLIHIIRKSMSSEESNPYIKEMLPYKIVFVTEPEVVGSFLMLKFSTPIPGNPKRKTSVKVFGGRKVNILGASHPIPTIRIFNYLSAMLEVYYHSVLFVKEIRPKVSKKRNALKKGWTTLF